MNRINIPKSLIIFTVILVASNMIFYFLGLAIGMSKTKSGKLFELPNTIILVICVALLSTLLVALKKNINNV